MLGIFGSKAGNAKDNKSNRVFGEENIKQLLEIFNISDQTHQTLRTTSGSSLVISEAAIKNLKTWYEQNTGRKLLKDFALELSVNQLDLQATIQGLDWVVLSHDSSKLLSRKEQHQTIEDLKSLSEERFVELSKYCDQHQISVAKFLNILSHFFSQDPNYLNFWPSQDLESPVTEEHTNAYAVSPKLWGSIEQMILKLGTDANGEERILKSNAFPGLDLTTAYLVCESMKKNNSAITGVFKKQQGHIIYISEQSMLSSRENTLKELLSGDVPFMDISNLIGNLPGQFKDAQEASSFYSNQSLQVVMPHIVSKKWLENQVEQLEKTIKIQKWASIEQLYSNLPKAMQNDIRHALIETVTTSNKVIVQDDWLFAQELIDEIIEWSKGHVIEVANELWQKDGAERPKSSVVTSQTRSAAVKEFEGRRGVSGSALEVLLKAKKSEFDPIIIKSWNTAMDELDSTCDEEFRKFWTQRIVNKSRLYIRAWEVLEEGSLKVQLEEVLLPQLISDVSQATNRAKTRKLLQSQRSKVATRVKKLEETLAQIKDIPAVSQELEKFNSKVEIKQYSEEELRDLAISHLNDMVLSMSKDEDGARLFISLLLILWSEKSQGVLYATGKFAPKVLKLLKPQLEAEHAEFLNKTKDAVKSGAITPEMKERMRKMASDALSKD